MPYPIGETAVQLSQMITGAALMSNVGAATVYLGPDTSVSPLNYEMRLDAGATVNWSGGDLFAICNTGESSSIGVKYGANTSITPGPSNVTSSNDYQYLGLYQFNTPIGPIDLSGFSSLILIPTNLPAYAWDLGVQWGNNVNFYDLGDGAGWDANTISGVYVLSVKATWAQFSIVNPGGGNPGFYVYASANPIPERYYNLSTPIVATPFEAHKSYGTIAIGASAGSNFPISSIAGKAHVSVTVGATATNTGNGLIVEFMAPGGRIIDRHILFDANPFAAQTYDVIFPRFAVTCAVTNFTSITQQATIGITFDRS